MLDHVAAQAGNAIAWAITGWPTYVHYWELVGFLTIIVGKNRGT